MFGDQTASHAKQLSFHLSNFLVSIKVQGIVIHVLGREVTHFLAVLIGLRIHGTRVLPREHLLLLNLEPPLHTGFKVRWLHSFLRQTLGLDYVSILFEVSDEFFFNVHEAGLKLAVHYLFHDGQVNEKSRDGLADTFSES